MSKIRNKIAEIVEKANLSPEVLEDLIEKDNSVILSLNIDYSGFNRDESKKFSAEIEFEIRKIAPDKKITIILNSGQKMSQNSQNIVKNNEKPVKKSGFLGFFGKNNEESAKKTQKDMKTGEKLLNSANDKALKGVKKIIAVASAKGGVGKSTFAVNLAASLNKIGYKIALVDADIYGPSIPHLMNLQAKPEIKDGLFIPLVSQGIKCMSIGFIIDENAAGVWRGPMITKILHQLIKSVNWNFDGADVDYMIVDMPPGTGDVYLSLAQTFSIDGVVIVSTPQSVAVVDVVRSVDCFRKLQVPILGLVQNMAFLEQNGKKQYIFGKDNAKNMAQKYDIKFLGDIPLSQEISDSSEEKLPFVIKNPSSNLALIYGKIAEDILL